MLFKTVQQKELVHINLKNVNLASIDNYKYFEYQRAKLQFIYLQVIQPVTITNTVKTVIMNHETYQDFC